jgi:hypothetical protein
VSNFWWRLSKLAETSGRFSAMRPEGRESGGDRVEPLADATTVNPARDDPKPTNMNVGYRARTQC